MQLNFRYYSCEIRLCIQTVQCTHVTRIICFTRPLLKVSSIPLSVTAYSYITGKNQFLLFFFPINITIITTIDHHIYLKVTSHVNWLSIKPQILLPWWWKLPTLVTSTATASWSHSKNEYNTAHCNISHTAVLTVLLAVFVKAPWQSVATVIINSENDVHSQIRTNHYSIANLKTNNIKHH